MEVARFRQLVAEALVDLPSEFARKLDNVEVVVELEPSWQQRLKMHLPPWATLFGLYEGVPATRRGAGYAMVLPDKITIFQGPIERFARCAEDIKLKIRAVVLHEIGHHFGLNETQLQNVR